MLLTPAQIKPKSFETKRNFFFFTRGGCVSCLRACLVARLLPQSYRYPDSKHWFTTSFLQPLPYLVTPQGPENCQLTSSFFVGAQTVVNLLVSLEGAGKRCSEYGYTQAGSKGVRCGLVSQWSSESWQSLAGPASTAGSVWQSLPLPWQSDEGT